MLKSWEKHWRGPEGFGGGEEEIAVSVGFSCGFSYLVFNLVHIL